MEIDPTIGNLLERRHSHLVKQLADLAMGIAPRLQAQDSRAALLEIDVEMPNIVQTTDVLLDRHGAEDQITCLHLIALITHLEPYMSLRGLWDLKLNWTLALLKPSALAAPHLTHILFNVAGTAYDEKGEHEKAIELYELAIKHANNTDLPEVLRIYGNLSTAYRSLGRLDEAMFYMRRVWDTEKKAGNQYGTALALANLAELHLELGDTEGALLAAVDAFKLAHQLGNPVLEAQFGALTAKQMVASGLMYEAIPLYQITVDLLMQLNDGVMLGTTLLNYAVLQHLLKHEDAAAHLVEASIMLFEQFGMQEELQKAETLLKELKGH